MTETALAEVCRGEFKKKNLTRAHYVKYEPIHWDEKFPVSKTNFLHKKSDT